MRRCPSSRHAELEREVAGEVELRANRDGGLQLSAEAERHHFRLRGPGGPDAGLEQLLDPAGEGAAARMVALELHRGVLLEAEHRIELGVQRARPDVVRAREPLHAHRRELGAERNGIADALAQERDFLLELEKKVLAHLVLLLLLPFLKEGQHPLRLLEVLVLLLEPCAGLDLHRAATALLLDALGELEGEELPEDGLVGVFDRVASVARAARGDPVLDALPFARFSSGRKGR
jgi:hypothetical protein